MSVLKSKRGISKAEFINTAINLRKYVVFKLLKDFGLKDYVRDSAYFIHDKNLTKEEKEQLGNLLRKCEYNVLLEQYPEWFLRHERDYINGLCRDMVKDIFHANNIYVTCDADVEERRKYQNSAIANVTLLLQELTFLLDVIPAINATKLKPLIELANKEIALLKGWRKSDYKRKESLR